MRAPASAPQGTAEAVARQVGALSPSSALAGSEDEDGSGISYTGESQGGAAAPLRPFVAVGTSQRPMSPRLKPTRPCP